MTPPPSPVCPVCDRAAPPLERASVRCNVRRHQDRRFGLWRCALCRSLNAEVPVDLPAFYQGYPIRGQGVDLMLRIFFRRLERRLTRAGFSKNQRLLDYGCNTGHFVRYLRGRGFAGAVGYDPYVPEFDRAEVLKETYDVVFSSDVLEHDEDPRGHFARLVDRVARGGLLVVQTPNAAGIDLSRPEDHLHQIHVPYHRHILSVDALIALGNNHGVRPTRLYTRWYMDSPWPGCSRRFIEAWLKAQGNLIDAAYEPPAWSLFFRHPTLLWLLLFGGFPPSRKSDHMMVIFRKGPGPSPSPAIAFRPS